ncbi:sodium/proton antiporter (CPA1 family) [Tenacibaculum adriaticum]|uniref:Sodium/proton antiporter (CPA1 family) n=1 Tax=Tenacibaculum adriaticum TaxID=413713 RepID=A0A5S5DV49_9FLAO|nr:cation:proton antiporter [Tenacibaculum adriaticum]TYP98926.1 sodium/proton antiporter (CPA1 family) [Tenacibaculum adriaticum]
MEIFTSYNLIILISTIIIISFLFDKIAKKTNIPSVLMLIGLGVVLQYALKFLNVDSVDLFPVLKMLGIVGLIMIVLEGALELELKKEKIIPILKAFGVAFIGLLSVTWAIANILDLSITGMSSQAAWLYATPLAILSSAIVIPSVAGLSEEKKEFHIYESTFSDILGIIQFYFLLEQFNPEKEVTLIGYSGSIIFTVIISLILSYIIILVFQNIERKAKLFLLVAVLLLLYAIGKKMHLSSLIIILIFGLVIANTKLFFRGFLKEYIKKDQIKELYHELHFITAEAAFVVRTLFFVVFGITIVLSSLVKLKVVLVSVLILAIIFLFRYARLRLFFGKNITPQLWIAPRGLITVLLFYGIPETFLVPDFEPGILLFVILSTGIIMSFGLINNKPAIEDTEEVYDITEDYDDYSEDFLEEENTPE